jgi:hypothetical protein
MVNDILKSTAAEEAIIMKSLLSIDKQREHLVLMTAQTYWAWNDYTISFPHCEEWANNEVDQLTQTEVSDWYERVFIKGFDLVISTFVDGNPAIALN